MSQVFFDNSLIVFLTFLNCEHLTIEYVSDDIEQFGYSADQFLSGRMKCSDIIFDDDKDMVLREFEKHKKNNNDKFRLECRIIDANKAVKRISCDTVIKRDSNGEVERYIGTMREQVELMSLHESKHYLPLLSQVMFKTADLVKMTDENGKIVFANDAVLEHTGYTKKELIGQKNNIFKTGKHSSSFYKEMWKDILSQNIFRGIFTNKKKNGDIYYEYETITPIKSPKDKVQYFVSIGKDITQCVEKERELYYLATIDNLTEIYNRQRCNIQLDIEMERFQRYRDTFALIMLDIDNFKHVNDLYGHDVGDKVLKKMAKVISKQIRKSDLFARWGGEEFMIIASGLDIQAATKFAEKLRNKTNETTFKDVEHVSISIGITSPKVGETKEELLKRVDMALYISKNKGKNCVSIL